MKVEEQLVPGAIIKNYKELCSTLGLPVQTGKSKQLQIANLNRFFSFEKDGQKYLITEVFDSPYEKEDKRLKGNRAIFVTYIESLLLNYFIRQGTTTCNFTKRQLWEMLGLVNGNYIKNIENGKFLYVMQMDDNRVRQWHIDRFYKRSRKKLNDVIRSALKSLKSRGLIEYRDDVIVGCRKGKHFEIKDAEQIEKILEIRKETLNEMGCKNMQEVMFNKNKKINMKAFNKLLNKKLYELYEIDFIYQRYSIICNRKYLEQGLKENEVELRQYLNDEIIDAVNELAEKEFDQNRADLRENRTHFIFPNYYVDIQNLLATKLLNINEKLIPEFIDTLQIEAEIDEMFPI